MLSIVVAIGNNNIIGSNGTLPWYLPSDLKKFKDITSTGSKTMIMGRKTFESLKKVLPGRKHLILTHNKDFNIIDENVEVLHSIDELRPYIKSEEEYYLIGGGEIFNILFPYVAKMYLTKVYGDFTGDTFFPKWKDDEWQLVEESEGIIDEKNKFKHTFMTLIRR